MTRLPCKITFSANPENCLNLLYKIYAVIHHQCVKLVLVRKLNN